LKTEIGKRGIKSIAMPALGYGLGGLKWEKVRNLIKENFADDSGVEILLFFPND